MASSENFLAQLKAVVDPLTVFGHYVTLKKSGSRYKARCPFHTEKTPSFYASSNGMFHCFGCGAGGDVITFVMNIEKLDFKECIQLLSSRYGIPLKHISTGERKEREILLDLMRQAAEFYHNLLTSHASGEAALQNLEERGITRDTIKRFQLGWAPPGWHSLLEHFQKRDTDPALLEKCGLVVARKPEGHYDRYRSRIMIPILDIHGNILGFGGRIFQGSPEEAKYVNSPETSLYSKSNRLFGLYFSKDSIQEKNFAILVEGYFDMIVPFQYGHTNIVASLGTSLTENQAKLLRRYTDRVVIFYDPDAAGQAAAQRALPILLHENFMVSVGSLPENLDPDSFLRKYGSEEFQSQLENALRYDQVVMKSLREKYDLSTSNGRLAASEELINLLEAVTNPFEQIEAMKKFALAVGIPPELMHDLYRKRRRTGGLATSSRTTKKLGSLERDLLQIFLLDPDIGRQVLPEFEEEDFEGMTRADLFRQLKDILTSQEQISTAELIHSFSAEDQTLLSALALQDAAPTPSADYARDWLYSKIRKIRNERLSRQLDQQIEEAKVAADQNLLDELLAKKLELSKGSKFGI